MDFEAARSRGGLIGAGAAILCLALSIGLGWAAAQAGPSPRAVLLLLPLVALLPLGAWLAYGAVSHSSLRYHVGRDGVIMRWSGARQVVPMAEITHLLNRPVDETKGPARLPIWRAGRAVVHGEDFGEREALVLATVPPAEQLLIVTRALAYCISPADPASFVDEFKRRRALGARQALEERTEPPRWARFSILGDRLAGLLIVACAAICGLAFALLAWQYPDLPGELSLRFRFDSVVGAPLPGPGAPTRIAWRLPILGLAALVFNGLLAFRVHDGARLAARLLLVGALLVQLALAVAVIRAI